MVCLSLAQPVSDTGEGVNRRSLSFPLPSADSPPAFPHVISSKNKNYITTGGVLSQCLTTGVISHPLSIGSDNYLHVSSVYLQRVTEYRRSITWEKGAPEAFALFLPFLVFRPTFTR